jgi:acyl-CoA reductase-like NAD-dependent aldehyde dehydrogenase
MKVSPDSNGEDWIVRAKALKLQVRNLIGGRWSDVGGAPIDKYSPRDGSLLCTFGAGVAQGVNEAVATARDAFEDGRWSGLRTARRKEILCRWADLLASRREEFALLECIDVGKPINAALAMDVPDSVECLRWSAEAADKLAGRVYGVNRSSLSYQMHRPLGVVAGVVGWNFPLLLAASKMGPVLATGNSLVLKPSEFTSFSAAKVAEIALEAGLPEGVLNVIHGGAGVGSLLARHPDVDLITFTGSSATGKQLLIASGESNMKRLVLECGGKAPNIVFEDSPDLGAVADAVVARAFYNQGQVCSASSRLLVQENIKDALMSILLRKVNSLQPGDPLRRDTTYGALVSHAHLDKVRLYIESGEREGAQVCYRSLALGPYPGGFYLGPVIFDRVSPQQRIAQEEIFGPVLSVISFRDEADAVRIANSTIYGLSAILWTKDMARAHRVTHGLRAGWVVVNATAAPAPAEGAISVGGLKQSGIGTEGGLEGLEEYTSKAAVQIHV